jgi:hypothetical protein
LETANAAPIDPDAVVAGANHGTKVVGDPELCKDGLDPGVQGLAWPVAREARTSKRGTLEEMDTQAARGARDRGRATCRSAANDGYVGVDSNVHRPSPFFRRTFAPSL